VVILLCEQQVDRLKSLTGDPRIEAPYGSGIDDVDYREDNLRSVDDVGEGGGYNFDKHDKDMSLIWPGR